jgi:signal transduction histidine kinase
VVFSAAPMRLSPKSWALLVAAAVLAGLTGLVVVTHRWLERDRREVAEGLARERASWLRVAAQGIEDDMQDIVNDLRYFGSVVQRMPAPEPLLTGSLGTVNAYHTIAVYERSGEPALSVTDPLRPSAVSEDMTAALAQTAAAALAQRAFAVVTSPSVLESDAGWLRAFAVRLGDDGAHAGGAVALLLDTHGFLARFRLIASDPHTEILFLGPDERPSPITSPAMARAYRLEHESRRSGFGEIVDAMRRGATGTRTLTRAEAGALGLGDAEWICAFTSIRLDGTSRWPVATFTSLAVLGEHEARVLSRVTAVAVTIALVLLGFAAYVMVTTRRTAVLRERLRHAGEVQALQGQLLRAEKLSTVGQIAAGIAHEVGTPLSIVRARAEYIAGKLGEPHPQSKGLAVIVEQTDLIARVISRLLDFSRAEPADLVPVDVHDAIDDCLELLHFEAARRGLRLLSDVEPGLLPVTADAAQLQQVLVNLLLNAFDACGSAGRVLVRATADSERGRVCIEIEDDGCGIEGSDLGRVFEPFFTTKPRGRGTGLGLSVVAQIARTHGAQIAIDSERGSGTRVRLFWPASAAPVAARRAAG